MWALRDATRMLRGQKDLVCRYIYVNSLARNTSILLKIDDFFPNTFTREYAKCRCLNLYGFAYMGLFD